MEHLQVVFYNCQTVSEYDNVVVVVVVVVEVGLFSECIKN